MSVAAFLPDRSLAMASLPWLKASLTMTALSLAVVGTLAVRFHPSPRTDEEPGVEMVIEFAPLVTQAESRPQMAAAQALPDQQARPEMQEVQSRETEADLPTEQASPSEAEDRDLRMAQERTQKASETAPERAQATEAADAQQQVIRSEASMAVETAPAQRAETPRDQAAAPDVGNARDAELSISVE